jgi:hypothetical protein
MFISGQVIQTECKWNLDDRYPIRKWSLFTQVHAGDKVFMKHCDIPRFIEYAKQFLVKVDAVIHNSDESFTTDDFNRIQPFVRNVYAVNCTTLYAHTLPLGFRDHQYVSHHVMKSIADEPEVDRSITCLVNFLISTNVPVRQHAYEYFKDKPFCTLQDYVSYDLRKSLTHNLPETMDRRIKFYRTLKHTKFAVCPAGTGIDTHRVYECILFGVIPIVLSSPIDSLYQTLPVWIVRDWGEVTEDAMNTCTIQPNPNVVKEFRIQW